MGSNNRKMAGIGLFILWLGLLVSCGGSGGGTSATGPVSTTGTSFSTADMNGEYRVASIEFGPDSSTTLLDIACDGNGNYTASILFPASGTETGTYAIDSDGILTVNSDKTGQISDDVNVFQLVDTDLSDNEVSLVIGLKKGTAMQTADLAGGYSVFVLGATPYDLAVLRFGFLFNGTGSVTYTSISTTGNNGTLNYSVANDGGIVFDDPGTSQTYNGQVSPDGETFIMVSNGQVTIGIKKSPGAGLSNADLIGQFHGIAIQDTDFSDGDDTFASLGTSRSFLDADGSTTVTVSDQEISGGIPSATYDMANVNVYTDGTMNAAGKYIGHLSANLGMFILSDDPIGDGDSKIIIGIKMP